ncbi:hypothetical protein [Natronolimnobius sp. AArcel1]|nr:hypothetical protein [Natronolimnobius sp. AArcel1]
MTRTRLETSIQHLAGIPPAVEAPAFTPGEDVTPVNRTADLAWLD